MEVSFMDLQAYKVQPLHMELPQVAAFSSIVDLMNVMSFTLHVYFELKSLDYEAITIEFVNCLPTKSMVTYYLTFVLFVIHWDNSNNCKVWTKRSTIMLGASCRTITLKIHLDWASKQQNALDICVVKMILILYFNVLLCIMKFFGVGIVCNF
jgi:hypothetical protein